MASKEGVNLTGFSLDQLQDMIGKADQTGYYKGIPQGLLAQELAKRESGSVKEVVTPSAPLLPDKTEKSPKFTDRFSQADFVDQLMEARRVPGWDKKK